jgi:hypothetical protein
MRSVRSAAIAVAGLLWLCAQPRAIAQPAGVEAQPAYKVGEIAKPTVLITPSWKEGDVINRTSTNLSIRYAKTAGTGPQRVLLGVELDGAQIHDPNVLVLSDANGRISLDRKVAIVQLTFGLSGKKDVGEARLALFEAVSSDASEPEYGKQVSNPVTLKLRLN